MKRKSLWAGVAALAAGLIFVTGGGAATSTTITFTVNSTADSTTPCTIASHKSTGTCTLRGAVLAADALGNDNTIFVIKLAAKTYHLSLGTLGLNARTGNTANLVQIVGATAGKKKLPASTIDGSGNAKPASVFELDSPTQMSNVVVTGGSGDTGGGIWMDSALDMENSIVRGNTSCASWTGSACDATSYRAGGGIYMSSGAASPHLSLSKTTVTKNVASFGGGIDNEGGHASSVAIYHSHIDKNVACDAFSHGVCVGGGSGGGVADDGESMLIEYSTVNGNQAGSPAYDINNDESWGGGIYTDEDTTQLFHTVVKGNVAGQYGGGVYAYDLVDFVNSSVTGNVADDEGGGVYYDYLLTSKNSTFAHNVAGGTFECTIGQSSTSCKHTAKGTTGTCATLYPSASSCIDYDGYGGGLYSDGEFAQFIATSISNNVAASITGDATNCGGGLGGGVYTDWTFTLSGGSKITNNTADCGGGIYNYYGGNSVYTFDLADSLMTGNSALEDGGAIWTGGGGSGTLYGMVIAKNYAGRQTGGVWDDQIGSVLLGSGNKIAGNLSTGACKNITLPCK